MCWWVLEGRGSFRHVVCYKKCGKQHKLSSRCICELYPKGKWHSALQLRCGAALRPRPAAVLNAKLRTYR